MKPVEFLVIVLVSFSIFAGTNGEFCDALSSVNCLNDTNQVLLAGVRSSTRICFLCDGLDCLNIDIDSSAQVECDSSCYIGIDGKLT